LESGAKEKLGEGLTVLTGGSGGVAVSCVRRLAREGGRFLLADVAEAALAKVADELTAEGIAVDVVRCDVSDRGEVEALAARAAAIGPTRALIHTAGIAPPAPIDPRRMLEVNLVGTCLVLDAFEPFMGPGSTGICIASLAAYRRFTHSQDELLAEPLAPEFLDRAAAIAEGLHNPVLGSYALSKRGVVVQCERRAGTWGDAGARLMSISPGLILDTSIGRAAATIHAGAYAEQSAVGRAGTADDVADVVAFLISPAASYLSGGDILLDGGVLAHVNWSADPATREAWHGLTS
jgi:NAD(P)-dependent dehydrogenase (short-subunit alcohol dehydrogenase family)